MANAYSHLLVHFVFASKKGSPEIDESWSNMLSRQIKAICSTYRCTVVEVSCVSDHVHLLIELAPTIGCAELMKYVKGFSSLWVTKSNLFNTKFEWERGYLAIALPNSLRDETVQFINNQKEFHENTTFKEEQNTLLTENGVPFSSVYLMRN